MSATRRAWYAGGAPGRDAGSGVKHLLDSVRDAGGKVVFITNRDEVSRTATRDNLAAYDLFVEGDTSAHGRQRRDLHQGRAAG